MEKNVQIGTNTYVDKSVEFIGKVTIGENCYIGKNNVISNSTIGNNNKIESSYIYDSLIGDNNSIGPFSHIRDNSVIENHCRIGNFVEIKKSILHTRVKCAHLSYLGDAEIGENTNIGCGVITANYNGKTKSKTVIQSNSFIGSNCVLIAPINIGKNVFIAASSTVTESIPDDSFVISRPTLEIKKRILK